MSVGLTFATIVALWRLFQFNEVALSLVVFPAVLVLELAVLRKWCSQFCPLGALLSLLSRLNRTFRPATDEGACLRSSKGEPCHRCAEACPEGIDLHDPAASAPLNECTKCRACADACRCTPSPFPSCRSRQRRRELRRRRKRRIGCYNKSTRNGVRAAVGFCEGGRTLWGQTRRAEGGTVVRASRRRACGKIYVYLLASNFLGFGAYYAWIFLCYNTAMCCLAGRVARWGSNAMLAMYLASTAALGVVLIAAGVFHNVATRIVESRSAVLSMAGVAAVATLTAAWSSPSGSQDALFMVSCALTGVGTAFVALRLGSVYSTVGARQALMYTAGSFIFAGMLFFVCIGLPHRWGCWRLRCFLLLRPRSPWRRLAGRLRPPRTLSPCANCPAVISFGLRFRWRCSRSSRASPRGSWRCSSRFRRLLIKASLSCSPRLAPRCCCLCWWDCWCESSTRGQLYYPIIILACLGNLAVPLFGGFGVIQGELASIAYNLFILMVWCLLANVANRTDLAYATVFGWGRGASAAGTTIGWFAGSSLAPLLLENPSNMVAFAMGMVFVLLVVSMVVLNERTIGQALKKTRNSQANQAACDPSSGERSDGGAGGFPPRRRLDEELQCASRASGPVFARTRRAVLAGKGLHDRAHCRRAGHLLQHREESYSQCLCESGYTYIYCVHSKQELQSLIEQRKGALQAGAFR